MPFPHRHGRLTIDSAWARIQPQPVGPVVARCARPLPTRMCLQVRDSVTLGPLRGVTVRLGAAPAGGAEQTFEHAATHYAVVAEATTDADGWVRFGGTAHANPLDDLAAATEAWAVEVVLARANAWREFQEDDAPAQVVLRATATPFRVYSQDFHAMFDVRVDWADPELPADLHQVVAHALTSPLRLYVDDGANFGNQAAAFFLLQTLHRVAGELGALDLSICASAAPIMGEERVELTIYRRVRAADVMALLAEVDPEPTAIDLPEDELSTRFNARLLALWQGLRDAVVPVLTAAFTDDRGPAEIMPADVPRATNVVRQDAAGFYRTDVTITATGTYDVLTQITGEYLAERLAAAGVDGPVWVFDHRKEEYSAVDDDEHPQHPSVLARGCAFEAYQLDQWLCVGVVCRATVRPYQRTIRSRFDIIRRGSPMADAAGVDDMLVDEFEPHDDTAIGLVAASDESSQAELAEFCSDTLRTSNAVFLQPYRWKRDTNLGLSGRGAHGRTLEPLGLPPDAAYLLAAEAINDPLVAAIGQRDAAVMTAYGLHQPHGTTTAALYTRLVEELLHLHDSIDREILLVVIFKAELPALGEALAARVRMVDPAQPFPAYDAARPLLVVKLTSVSNGVFANLVAASTLPVVLEGANTMNMALMLGRPVLSVATHTTDYPRLECGEHEDRFAEELAHLTGLLRGDVETPAERPARAADPLDNPVLSHFFERVLAAGAWRRYFAALQGYIAHDRRNQLLLALYRLQVRRRVRVIPECACRRR